MISGQSEPRDFVQVNPAFALDVHQPRALFVLTQARITGEQKLASPVRNDAFEEFLVGGAEGPFALDGPLRMLFARNSSAISAKKGSPEKCFFIVWPVKSVKELTVLMELSVKMATVAMELSVKMATVAMELSVEMATVAMLLSVKMVTVAMEWAST